MKDLKTDKHLIPNVIDTLSRSGWTLYHERERPAIISVMHITLRAES